MQEAGATMSRLLHLDVRADNVREGGGGSSEWLNEDAWPIYTAVDDGAGVGDELASFDRRDGGRVAIRRDPATGTIAVPFSFDEAADGYLRERWVHGVHQRRLGEPLLNVFYRVKRVIPRAVQLSGRRAMIRWQRIPAFPRWPLDDSGPRLASLYAATALTAAGVERAPFRWFWPEGRSAAFMLTHDVEGIDGVRRMLEIADLEEELGFRSSFNVGAWYTLDPGLVSELHERGFELGVHGLRHDRSLFASREAFTGGLDELKELRDRVGAVGFRSPATHRVHEWMHELPFDYDCSVPNSDPYEPQPGGCCSVWPYFMGDLVELPYTLPQDHTLFTLLGHRTPGLWVEQAARIERLHGLIQCVSHPDAGYLGDADKRALYREFLVAMKERDEVWHALPRDVATWWRGRDQGNDDRIREGTAVLAGDGLAVDFVPPVSAGS